MAIEEDEEILEIGADGSYDMSAPTKSQYKNEAPRRPNNDPELEDEDEESHLRAAAAAAQHVLRQGASPLRAGKEASFAASNAGASLRAAARMAGALAGSACISQGGQADEAALTAVQAAVLAGGQTPEMCDAAIAAARSAVVRDRGSAKEAAGAVFAALKAKGPAGITEQELAKAAMDAVVSTGAALGQDATTTGAQAAEVVRKIGGEALLAQIVGKHNTDQQNQATVKKVDTSSTQDRNIGGLNTASVKNEVHSKPLDQKSRGASKPAVKKGFLNGGKKNAKKTAVPHPANQNTNAMPSNEAGGPGSVGDDGSHFEPAAVFTGRREGFVFKTGAKGTGYYRDSKPRVDPTNHPATPPSVPTKSLSLADEKMVEAVAAGKVPLLSAEALAKIRGCAGRTSKQEDGSDAAGDASPSVGERTAKAAAALAKRQAQEAEKAREDAKAGRKGSARAQNTVRKLSAAQKDAAKMALQMTPEQVASLPQEQQEMILKFREDEEFKPLRQELGFEAETPSKRKASKAEPTRPKQQQDRASGDDAPAPGTPEFDEAKRQLLAMSDEELRNLPPEYQEKVRMFRQVEQMKENQAKRQAAKGDTATDTATKDSKSEAAGGGSGIAGTPVKSDLEKLRDALKPSTKTEVISEGDGHARCPAEVIAFRSLRGSTTTRSSRPRRGFRRPVGTQTKGADETATESATADSKVAGGISNPSQGHGGYGSSPSLSLDIEDEADTAEKKSSQCERKQPSKLQSGPDPALNQKEDAALPPATVAQSDARDSQSEHPADDEAELYTALATRGQWNHHKPLSSSRAEDAARQAKVREVGKDGRKLVESVVNKKENTKKSLKKAKSERKKQRAGILRLANSASTLQL